MSSLVCLHDKQMRKRTCAFVDGRPLASCDPASSENLYPSTIDQLHVNLERWQALPAEQLTDAHKFVKRLAQHFNIDQVSNRRTH